ncbi:MAG: DUF362 domain-containing protein [Candidatus Eremiobacteraeota bacterium]|nr:DUF362 domain-containing protein [Candidatus Eremiobacteraeota bacterium]
MKKFCCGMVPVLIALLFPGFLFSSGQVWPEAEKPAGSQSPRVVHIHDTRATSWDYRTGWYGDYVDQDVVNAMMDRGIAELTGKGSAADAWRAIIPAYRPGQKIAIKVNFNNAIYGSSGQVIDAIPQPVNAVVKGLKERGVREDDIWVYDVTHGWHIGEIPERFMKKISPLYPGVQFHSNDNLHTVALGYSDTERVHFNVPPGRSIPDRRICNALVKATYLINMPIIKKHRMAGVSLSFKNHFGSIEGNDEIHWSVTLDDPLYLPGYSGLVDLYRNHNIRDKTVLIIGEGLYGARINNYTEVPSPWPTFGNRSPNSLFFSQDPVAVDSVMYDFLEAEGGLPKGSDNYLKLAGKSGLGIFEHRDASGAYRKIDYRRIEE